MTKSTITRERAQQIFLGNGPEPSASEERELARMALAAMDSEPVGKPFMYGIADPDGNAYIDEFCVSEDLGLVEDTVNELNYDREEGDELNYSVVALYRHAQPAPVVPEEKPMPNPLSMYAVDAVAAIAEAKGWNACRAAMLQHQPQNAQQNIPENIPGGLVEAVNNLLNNDGSRGCYDAMECGTAREKIELWLAQRQRWEEQRKANLSAGNSPVIPDGYVMVPKEPTQAMCAAFNDSDYGRKSLRERYVAMLAAAPQEVK